MSSWLPPTEEEIDLSKIIFRQSKLIDEAQKLFQEYIDQENYLDSPWCKDVIAWLIKSKEDIE